LALGGGSSAGVCVFEHTLCNIKDENEKRTHGNFNQICSRCALRFSINRICSMASRMMLLLMINCHVYASHSCILWLGKLAEHSNESIFLSRECKRGLFNLFLNFRDAKVYESGRFNWRKIDYGAEITCVL
jgi:hypothetical protein